ncbi:unnamed protein product [Choristocarpus tenellus]
MLSSIVRSVGVAARGARPQTPALLQVWRGMCIDGKIPEGHAVGRQKQEQEKSPFNRDPIFPPKGSGTKNMPIEVPSQHDERVVGFEHPETHVLLWFNMKAGKVHYVSEIDKYFKLVPNA